uniref:Uncharacterized protein n=1 Tax=Tanacetum cinerariifolium TaxID=118510 RepID=A0A6L2KID2_TANCI|nr:hypothetical protein [Tanacetum cinerariifolium]
MLACSHYQNVSKQTTRSDDVHVVSLLLLLIPESTLLKQMTLNSDELTRSTRVITPRPKFCDLVIQAESHEMFLQSLNDSNMAPVTFNTTFPQANTGSSSSRGRGRSYSRGSSNQGRGHDVPLQRNISTRKTEKSAATSLHDSTSPAHTPSSELCTDPSPHAQLVASPTHTNQPPSSPPIAPPQASASIHLIVIRSKDAPLLIRSWLESFVIIIHFVEYLAHYLIKVSVAPEVRAAAVASPDGVLKLDTHSSSEADPSESSLPPIFVAPMVSPFLYSDNLESDTEMPERHDIPIGRLYCTHPGGPCRALTAIKSVGPLPSHRLALRYTSHHSDRFTSRSSSDHSSSDHFSSEHSTSDHSSSGYSTLDHSSSGHSTSVHSLSRHTPLMSIWKAFGRNTRDLGSFGEEIDKTKNLNQHLSRISTQRLKTASQITCDAITTHTKTASQDLKMASDCTTQPII